MQEAQCPQQYLIESNTVGGAVLPALSSFKGKAKYFSTWMEELAESTDPLSTSGELTVCKLHQVVKRPAHSHLVQNAAY